MLNGFFKIFNGIFQRNNTGKFKERRLHNHVNASAKADLLSDFNGIDSIEVNAVLCDIAFNAARQVLIKLLCIPVAV